MSGDPLKSLREYYAIADEKQSWKLRCNKCTSTWRLGKKNDGKIPGSNILHLLSHANSHKPGMNE